jgi:hypothetical protein
MDRAFPFGDSQGCEPTYGMTLRDYFAAAALPACIVKCSGDTIPLGMTREEWFACKAYDCADAMLFLRDAPNSKDAAAVPESATTPGQQDVSTDQVNK